MHLGMVVDGRAPRVNVIAFQRLGPELWDFRHSTKHASLCEHIHTVRSILVHA